MVKLLALLAGVASAATLHVSPSGTNLAPCSVEAPCRTIQFASGLTKPGDVVQIGAGMYPERVFVTKSGTAGAPITYRGELKSLPLTAEDGMPIRVCPTTPIKHHRGARPDPSTWAYGFYIKADFINVECFRMIGLPSAGLTFQPGDLKSGVYIHTARHHVEVRDNHISGKYSAAVQSGPLANELPSFVTVERNYFYGTPYGMLFYCKTDCNFLDNESESLGGAGDSDHARVFGSRITYRGNYFHGNSLADCEGCHTDCFQTWSRGQYVNEMAKDVTIEGNTCLNVHAGIMMRDDKTGSDNYTHSNWTVKGNVFAFGPTGSTMAWCAHFEHIQGITFAGNVCYSKVGYFNNATAKHLENIHYGSTTPYFSTLSGRSPGIVEATANDLILNDGEALTKPYPNDYSGRSARFVEVYKLVGKIPR
jgi:hypothetical protein